MFGVKLKAALAAVVMFLLAAMKILVMQRDAAREDLRRANKHLDERKKVAKVEKDIKAEVKEKKAQAVEAIKRGEVPDVIRNPNDF